MRRGMVLAWTALALVAVTVGPFAAREPLLIWNASASAPVGVYRLETRQDLSVGERVAWRPDPRWSLWFAQRGYVLEGVPLLKPVAATAPSVVCREGDLVRIDGRDVALARDTDSAGRPLPRWTGCIALGPETVFLLAADAPDSLDGRYFGPVNRRELIGRVTPIRVREAGR